MTNKKYGVNEFTVDKENYDKHIDISNVAEEAVASKTFGKIHDTDRLGDSGIDVFLPNGKTIDVKATKYKDGNLLIPAHIFDLYGNVRADYVVLVTVDGETPTIRGYITKEEAKEAPIIPWTHKPCKKWEQNELRPIQDLVSTD